MSKTVTIRVEEQLHALLRERADAEGTTVTALITQAAQDAVRDPRLEEAGDVFRAFLADQGDAFDQAFPGDAPSLLDTAPRSDAPSRPDPSDRPGAPTRRGAPGRAA